MANIPDNSNGHADIAPLATAIADNVRQVTQLIEDACKEANRAPDSVALIAVSKRQSAAAVEAVYQSGLTHFGENYVQEAVPKVQALAHLPLTWHFIGPIQSNKTGLIAKHFSWVHSIDRLKIAKRLSDAGKRLNICLQINIDADPNKGGVAPNEAADLIAAILPLPNLQLRGLMCILDPKTAPLDGFSAVNQLFYQLQGQLPEAHHAQWDTLSMGMSGDYPQAIANGATLVRIGTAIFGARAH